MKTESKLATYVINLKRSTDRMESMDKALREMSIRYERIEAVDAKTLSTEFLERNATPSAEYPYKLKDGEIACFASHLKCWQTFLKSDAEWALIFEDHCVFSSRAARFLSSPDWIPSACELVQLIYSKNASFYDEKLEVLDGNGVVRLACSSPIGASAYLISRNAAEKAVRLAGKFKSPVDNYLFGPWSEYSKKIRAWRLLEPVVRRSEKAPTTILGRNEAQEVCIKQRLNFGRILKKILMKCRRVVLHKICQVWNP